jgi:hypothetical protein
MRSGKRKEGGGSVFDKRAGHVSAHSLVRTSGALRPRRLKEEKGTGACRVKGKGELRRESMY